jgi:putative NADH-flavin reductase
MQLTVFGATGRTGRLVVQQALDAGHEVTAVVRDPARLPATGAGLRVETVTDLADAQTLIPYVDGRDTVLSCLGPNGRSQAGIAEAGTRAIVRAMETAPARRLVVISAAPVGPVPEGAPFIYRRVLNPMMRAILKDAYADLAAMESEVGRSALDWTVVRPGKLSGKAYTGRYRRVTGANVPNARPLARADLAKAMLDFVTDEGTLKQAVGVSGEK